MTSTPSLSRLVREYLAQRLGQALTPHQIAEGISARLDARHVGVGAVTNICLYEVADGRLVLVIPAPATFAHPARAESDAGQQ